MVAATGLVPAHALTMDELSAAFPKNRVVEQCAFIFAHEGVNFVALANDAKEVGIILLLPVKSSHYQKVEELAERFRKLIPDGEKEFRVEPFTYRGKTSQALINLESLAQETSRRNCWMGIPLYQCLAYGLAKANGRIAGVSDDSIVMEVSNEVFGKMRVTVYLLSFGDVEIVDVVPRKRTKKSTENAEALSSEFDFSYRYAVDEDDVKDLKFRNNMETPVYIEAALSEGTLTFNIYGKETRPEGRSVEYISETLETVESDETRFVATEDPVGTMYTRDNGHTGLKAQLWKIVREDGVEVSREAVNYSTYLASGKTVAVGTFSENEEISAKINAAVEAQDEAQINAVIAEASGGVTQEEAASGGEN